MDEIILAMKNKCCHPNDFFLGRSFKSLRKWVSAQRKDLINVNSLTEKNNTKNVYMYYVYEYTLNKKCILHINN